MEKVIIFGIGNEFRKYKDYLVKKYDIVAYTANDRNFVTEDIESKFIDPTDILKYEIDKIIIATTPCYLNEITEQILTYDDNLSTRIISAKEACMEILKKCVCCGNWVRFLPLPEFYFIMWEKYQAPKWSLEFLNETEYECSECHASDRARMIITFLKRCFCEGKLLHIAPDRAVRSWILNNCHDIQYESMDFNRNDVDYKADIQNMYMFKDDSFDIFICSHVLEHVKDDRKAIKELFRILKPDGIGIFLVPIALDRQEIDEEWGLTEEENWKRFGQNDHCRFYAKEPLIGRLRKVGFYVNCLDREFFGEKIFEENVLHRLVCCMYWRKGKE